MTDREAAYMALAEAYRLGGDFVRRSIIEDWDFGVDWRYPDWERIPCTIGHQYSPLDRARALLLYGAIASAKRFICIPALDRAAYENARNRNLELVDYRDEIVRLARIYQAATAAGIDADHLFRDIATISPPAVGALIEEFAGRSAGLKSLEAFFLVRVTNADGETELRPAPHPWQH